MIRQRMIAGLVAAVAIVGLSACGSDSKSLITDPSKNTTEETTKSTTETTSRATTTTDASDDTATDDTVTEDTSGDQSSSGAETIPEVTTGEATGECVQLQQDLEDVLGTTDLGNLDADKFKQAFDEISKRVPSDLKDDVQTVEDAALPFVQAMATVGTDPTKALQDPDVQAAMTKMQSPEFRTASNNLNTWFNNGCPS